MIPITTYIFKATAFCNLNCSYCYMFNLGDTTYKKRPKVMPLELMNEAVGRIVDQAGEQNVAKVNIVFHGGEPLLAGKDWMRSAVGAFRRKGGERVEFAFGIQTNGIPIDAAWINLCDELGIKVSLSMDGPRDVNDRHRINHAGRGSYDAVVRGLRLLLDTPAGQRVFGAVLCVIDPEADGLAIFHHFLDLGVKRMDFLLPLDYNWDNPPPGHGQGSATPYADYMIPIFDEWWTSDRPDISVRNLEVILSQSVGYQTGLDSLGGHPISFGIIETDGSIEPLDVLRVCGDGFTDLNLNVRAHPISALYETNLFQLGLLGQDGLGEVCRICPLHDICGGGYLPHRYSSENGFMNTSVYCRDLWKLITHVLDAAEKTFADRFRFERPLEEWKQPEALT